MNLLRRRTISRFVALQDLVERQVAEAKGEVVLDLDQEAATRLRILEEVLGMLYAAGDEYRDMAFSIRYPQDARDN